MQTCKRCGAERVAFINGKCSDMCQFAVNGRDSNGYSPQNVGLVNSYGDYVEFEYCLDCGQIQGDGFPVKESALNTHFEKYGTTEEDED